MISKKVYIILFLLKIVFCNAQHTILSTGGEATSPECSMSFSVGQIDYTSALVDGNFSINLGIQQPYFLIPIIAEIELPKSDFIPNAFTPSSADGNAYWNLSKANLANNATIKVFNRNGITVFETTGKQIKDTPWDGGDLPASAYWYVIDRKDGSKVLTGSVTILK